jgi:hypothetical protein
MYQDDQIIEQLGIAALPADERENILEEARTCIGEAISEQLSEQQVNEYEAIINDDRSVIDAWLQTNVPDYKNAAVYQSFAEGFEEDPEHNNPEKLFANLAWLQLNVPNIQELVSKGLETFKQERANRST